MKQTLSNKLEQLEFKLEKDIGIQKHAGKVRKGFILQFTNSSIKLLYVSAQDL